MNFNKTILIRNCKNLIEYKCVNNVLRHYIENHLEKIGFENGVLYDTNIKGKVYIYQTEKFISAYYKNFE